MDEQVQWVHVVLAGVAVLMVMLASQGSSWLALVGWLGALAVTATWVVLVVRVRARAVRVPRQR